MSATRDHSQKIHFIPTNFYRLYRKGLEAAKTADLRGVDSGRVIKAHQVQEFAIHEPVLVALKNASLPAPAAPVAHEPFAHALRSEGVVGQLRANLRDLQAIQGRIRFLAREIQDLTKKRG